MNKRGQALMVALWVLIILTLLAIDLGHEVALGTRVGRYAVGKMEAMSLAKSALSNAQIELDHDRNDADGLTELWSRCDAFMAPDLLAKGGHACIVDEESKININTATTESLRALLESAGALDAATLSKSIMTFRDSSDHVFVNEAELVMVRGMTPDIVGKLRGRITVFGDGMININTVPVETLKILLRGIAKAVPGSDGVVESLAEKIVRARTQAGMFKVRADIDIPLDGGAAADMFSRLMDKAVFKSGYFLIDVTGQSRDITSRIAVVYERKNKKIHYWHEG